MTKRATNPKKESQMSSLKRQLIAASVAVLVAATAHAEAPVQLDAEKGAVWQAGLGGVEIEWAPGGTVKRVYSTQFHPVNFPDRRGINKAQTIAEEKAKAAIVRFMEQHSFSERFIEEIDRDIEKATLTRDPKGETWTKEVRREMVESLRQITGSYAAGRLRGVIVLEQGYDEKKAEAWTKVGISHKTMAAAQALRTAIQSDQPGATGSSSAGPSPMRQPSEVRRSNQKDW